MLVIKFSHEYCKLPKEIPKQVLLLEVFEKRAEDFSEAFRDYDTKFVNSYPAFDYYPLPKTGLFLILLFIDPESSQVFTTIRSWKKEKFNFYNSNRGNIFKVEIGNIVHVDFKEGSKNIFFPKKNEYNKEEIFQKFMDLLSKSISDRDISFFKDLSLERFNELEVSFQCKSFVIAEHLEQTGKKVCFDIFKQMGYRNINSIWFLEPKKK